MSTDLYCVHVEKLARATLTLKLVIQDAESGNLPDGKPWALMLLCEAPKIGLAKSIPAAQRIDEAFLSEAGDRFITSVTLVAKKNYPIADEQAYNEAAHGGDPKRAAWGRYQIVVADPASLAGLRVGATWDSASYAPPPRRAAIPPQPQRTAKAPAGNLIEQLLATELVELKRFEPDAAPVVRALRREVQPQLPTSIATIE